VKQAREQENLRYRHSLLFHDFVYRNSVCVIHFIEFINANNSAVSENHCPGLEKRELLAEKKRLV
jgi:hypothetical protein